MEVNRICCYKVHLVFTCLSKAIRVYVSELKWFGNTHLPALTRCNYPSRVVRMLLRISCHTRRVDRCLNRSEVIVTSRTCSLLLSNLHLRGVGRLARIVTLPLGTVALEEGGYLVLLVTVVAIDAVTPSFIAQVRVIAPLLRSRPSSQDGCLVVRTGFLVDQLCLVCSLLEALPMMLHRWVLMVGLADAVLVHRLQVIQVGFVNGRHDTTATTHFGISSDSLSLRQ